MCNYRKIQFFIFLFSFALPILWGKETRSDCLLDIILEDRSVQSLN